MSLITLLRDYGFDPSAVDVADLCWLALCMGAFRHAEVAPEQTLLSPAQPTALPGPDPQGPSPKPKNAEGLPSMESKQSSTPVHGYVPQRQEVRDAPFLPIMLPSHSALPNQLALARALRPLMRRIPARRRREVDEGASADQIARTRIWMPVLRPTPTRWFEVLLVVDRAPSMVIWRQMIVEWCRILEHQGAFRDVRIWSIITDHADRIRLVEGWDVVKGASRSPRELIDPTKRRLILLVSDCVAPAWQGGSVQKHLLDWGKHGHTAVVQVLPPALWERSVLGFYDEVALAATVPGTPNSKLRRGDPLDEAGGSPLPILSITTASLHAWANLVVGANGSVRGRLVYADPVLPDEERDNEPERDADERVAAFLDSASNEACRLARALALVPLSPPIMHLVHHIVETPALPQTAHMAEVLLGGLLHRQQRQEAAFERDEVQYEFYAGVREQLQQGMTIGEQHKVFSRLIEEVAATTGRAISFRAMLADPFSPQAAELAASNPAFATIAADALRKLGGRYAELAGRLDAGGSEGMIQERSITEAPVSAYRLVRDKGSVRPTGITRRRRRSLIRTPIHQPDPSSSSHINQASQSSGVSFGAHNAFAGPVAISDVAVRDIINYYGADTTMVSPLVRAYLRELSGTCSRLSLADLDSVASTRTALELQMVYVGLEVTRQVDLPPEDPQEQRERAIMRITQSGFAGIEAYAAAYDVTPETVLTFVIKQLTPRERQRRLRAVEVLAEHPCLVLTGAPGSGKSSFVSFVSFCLAKAWCGEDAWLTHLGTDWPHGRLIPIRVVLREFVAWLAHRPTPLAADPGLLWQWLEQDGSQPRLLVNHLRSAFADGLALLLLDGLDEVPAAVSGPLLTIISALASGRGRCVVTCRVLDYEGVKHLLPDWPVEQIAPLSAALRDQMIDHWFAALEQLHRTTRGSPAALRDDLKRKIPTRPELRRLAGTPLLVTMMIRLQAHDGDLPGEQVTLYRRSVDLLLLQWRRDAAGRVSLSEILALPQWSESHLNRLLDRLAYAAHERGVNGDGEQGADLPSEVAITTAKQFFAAYDPDRGYERAERFVNYISAHGNGIIQRHDHAIYRFSHRTFQAYLAGRRLLSDEDWPDGEQEFVERALKVSAGGPQWCEAVLLAISDYAMRGQIRPVLSLADEVLTRYTREGVGRDLLLAADILLEVGRERVVARNPTLWARLYTAITEMLQALNADRTAARYPVAERVRAGFMLGALGDARMPVTVAQWRTELAVFASGAGDGYFCPIAAGDYRIGSGDDDPDADDDEKPQHTVNLPHAYGIARFPITNAQWLAWVADGGTASRYADDDDLNHANQPVVGVTWDEVNAFCAWLTAQVADALPEGAVVRLPSEAEWEVAARGGTEARRYPWGNAWRDDSAAMEEDRQTRGVQWTVPVGCYPSGAAECGALDMAGNVWEWTLDRWHTYPGAAKPFTQDRFVVVRGGGHNTNRTYARCGARDRNHPDHDFTLTYGMRVCLAPRQRTF